MKTKENIYPALRIVIIAFIYILTAVAQNTFLLRFSVPLVLLVPLTVSVCAFEGEFAGAFLGIAGGALYDISSPVPDGVFTLLFGVLGCLSGLLMRYVFRETLLSVFLLTLTTSFFTAGASFIFTVLLKSGANAFSVFSNFYLSGAFLTAVTLPVFYYPIKYIETRLKKT